MRRALLVSFSLLALVVTAQALGLLSVPNSFEAGARMSASAMNANLDAVSGRLLVVRESVITTRRAQVGLRDRINAFAPAPLTVTSSGSEADLVLQQSEDQRPRFKAGDLVDADAVNSLLRSYVTGSDGITGLDGIDEFNALLVRDMVALSERISAAESALGLPDGERAETNLASYTSPALTAFRRNERIVPKEMNDNFAALTDGLSALEQNAAELAEWVAHELARMDAVEAAAGSPVLSEQDYLLPVVGSLDPGEFSAGTLFHVYALDEVAADGSLWFHDYQDGPFPVSGLGHFEFAIDARVLGQGDHALDAYELARAYLYVGDSSTQTRTVSVTNPDALLQAMVLISAEQPDPSGGWAVASHDFQIQLEVESEGVSYLVPGDLVFSDRPVTISGDVTSTIDDRVLELELRLEAGWNVVYNIPSASRPNVTKYQSRVSTPSDILHEATSVRILARDYAPVVYGYSLFGLHELQGGGEPRAFLSSERASTEAPLYLRVPRWVNHNIAPLNLVPIDEMVPGAEGAITTDTPAARMMLAYAYAYDQSNAASGQVGVFGSSSGRLNATSSNGNEILFIYSDRGNTVHASITDPEDDTRTIRTEAAGLRLHFGWNLIEAVRDGEDGLTITLVTYRGSIPNLELQPW